MTKMQTVIARPSQDIGDVLRAAAPQMVRALPATAGMTAERLTRIALTTIRVNPTLARCSSQSLLASLMQCAQLGMDPDPRIGHVYLVPYGPECQVIVGYRGLMELARRSGRVKRVEAHVVYEGDTFSVEYGSAQSLRHVPTFGERGAAVCVWARAVLDDGSEMFDVLSVADVEHARASSRAKGGPWSDHWDEMARKTAVRRLAKYLPLSVELAQALDMDGTRIQGAVGDIPGQAEVVTVEPDDAGPPVDEPAPKPRPAKPTNGDTLKLRDTIDGIAARLRELGRSEVDLFDAMEDLDGERPPSLAKWAINAALDTLARLGEGGALARRLAGGTQSAPPADLDDNPFGPEGEA